MFLLDKVRFPLRNALLRTATLAFATANTVAGNNISLFGKRSFTNHIAFPENRLYTKIEILYLCVSYLENNPYFPCIAGINI